MDESGLLMPFVTVTSNGGPHEDHAYVAGVEMGALAARLADAKRIHAERLRAIINRESVPQADLYAMHFGFVMTELDMHGLDDVENADEVRAEWAHLLFETATSTPEEADRG